MLEFTSLTRDQTRAPCGGGAESEPLDYQRSPSKLLFFYTDPTIRGSVFAGTGNNNRARSSQAS